MTKKEIRKEYKEIRKNIPSDVKRSESEIVIEKLIEMINKEEYAGILLYAPLEDEVDVFEVFNPVSETKFYFPKTSGDTMSFYEVKDKEDLEMGNFNVREPKDGLKELKFEEGRKYLMVVPGIAFDEAGYRIGYGRGYYDKFLAANSNYDILKVGVCFRECFLKDVCHDEFDIPSDMVIIG